MMLLNILRYFRGCVSVKVYGGFLENFINQCTEKNIKMWDIRYIDGSMYFFTQEKYLPNLEDIAEQSGLLLLVNSEFGLPYVIKAHKNRVALFVGTVIALAFVGLMNTRIWVIDVSGNKNIFKSEVMQVINELGVNIGTRKSKINAIEVQNKFLEIMKDEVLWVSLNVEGMCAEVQIREIEKFEDDAIGVPCNYVADFSGVITTYRVYSGTPVASRGDYVRKGDMLINSVIEYYDQGLNFVESRGKIIARRDKHVNTDKKIYTQVRKYIGTKKRYSLKLFSFEIPLTFIKTEDKPAEITAENNLMHVNEKTLPFGVVKYIYSFYEEAGESDVNKSYVMEKYISDVEFQTRNSNVISVETKLRNTTGVYELQGKIDCLDYMGEKVPLNFENIK